MLEIRDNLPITPRASMLIAVSVVVSVLVAATISLRMLRNIRFKKFYWDEVLIIFATVVQFASTAIYLASVPFGNGRHIYDFPHLPPPRNTIVLPWVGQPLSAAALLLAKSSLAVTLVKLGLGKRCNWIIISSMALLAVAVIWAIIQILVGCNPLLHPAATPCTASAVSKAGALFLCATNIVVDIVFFVAPEYFLRQTQLRPRDRLAIRCLLAFVFLATIASIVKVVYLQQLLRSADVTWYAAPVSAASQSESGMSIIAACLPAVRQLIGQRFPKHWMFWKSQGETSRSSGSVVVPPGHFQGYNSSTDLERAKARAKVKIMNDLDLSEEDGDVVKLISYSPKLDDTTPSRHPNGPDTNSTSRSVRIPVQSVDSMTLSQHDAVKGTHADSLQGRLSSRYRASDSHQPALASDESIAGATTFGSMLAQIDQVNSSSCPIDRAGQANFESRDVSQIDLGTSSSNILSKENRRRSPKAHQSTIPTLPIFRHEGREMQDVLGEPEDSSITAVSHHHTSNASDDLTALPVPVAAPYYFENKKIRRSAQPSMEATPQQSAQSAKYSRTSTPDSSSVYSGTAIAASWLRETRSATPKPS